MPEFDIEQLKNSWQKQEIKPYFGQKDILEMLNRKSRNYVKYILWISIAEFVFILAVNLFSNFSQEHNLNISNILSQFTFHNKQKTIDHFNFLLEASKVTSLLITFLFVYLFFKSYRKIKIETTLKELILQIMTFKKTVNVFIIINIVLVLFFMLLLFFVGYLNLNFSVTNIEILPIKEFVIGFSLAAILCIVVIGLYYKIVYGIIMNRLSKTLKQLRAIEKEQEPNA